MKITGIKLKGAIGLYTLVGGASGKLLNKFRHASHQGPFFQNYEIFTNNIEMKLCRYLD